VLGERLTCCDSLPQKPEGFEIIVPPRRRMPPPSARGEILARQNHRCLYCEGQFGDVVVRDGRAIVLRVVWDHFAPFSTYGDNSDGNFVAACQICNDFKRARIFQTREEAASYLVRRWAKAGISWPCGMGSVRYLSCEH
jgi:5-methylcytosine-specific restriction endonuclease McrA